MFPSNYEQGVSNYKNNNIVDAMNCFIKCVKSGNRNGWIGIAKCYEMLQWDEMPQVSVQKSANYRRLAKNHHISVNADVRLEEIEKKFYRFYH